MACPWRGLARTWKRLCGSVPASIAMLHAISWAKWSSRAEPRAGRAMGLPGESRHRRALRCNTAHLPSSKSNEARVGRSGQVVQADVHEIVARVVRGFPVASTLGECEHHVDDGLQD